MKNMKISLYHGSNAEVRQPEILPRLRALDFGAGFYLTSNQEQAIRWARLVARRRGTAQAILNRLTDQYAFLTPAALAFLEFDGSEIL